MEPESKRTPPETVVGPVKMLFVPPRTSVPVPVFVIPEPATDSSMTPPTVSVLDSTVTARVPASVTRPVERFSGWVPTNVKSPFHDWANEADVKLDAPLTSSEPPLMTSLLPVPRPAKPKTNVPALSVNDPV